MNFIEFFFRISFYFYNFLFIVVGLEKGRGFFLANKAREISFFCFSIFFLSFLSQKGSQLWFFFYNFFFFFIFFFYSLFLYYFLSFNKRFICVLFRSKSRSFNLFILIELLVTKEETSSCSSDAASFNFILELSD